MKESILFAIFGIISTLLGAYIGGKYSYKGAMDATSKQLEFEMEKIEKQQKEKNKIVVSLLKTFIVDEIKRNYNILNSDPNRQYIKFLKREIKSDIRSIGNYSFYYESYDKLKYDLAKNSVDIVKEVIDIYKFFEFIQNNGSKQFGKLSEEEKEFLKDGINKCESLIESLE